MVQIVKILEQTTVTVMAPAVAEAAVEAVVEAAGEQAALLNLPKTLK